MKDTISERTRQSEAARLRSMLSSIKKTDVSEATGLSSSYLSQLQSGHRPISIEAAIDIALFMHQPVSALSPRIAEIVSRAAASEKSVREDLATYKVWPFEQSTLARLNRLNAEALKEIEEALVLLIGQHERRSGNSKPSSTSLAA